MLIFLVFISRKLQLSSIECYSCDQSPNLLQSRGVSPCIVTDLQALLVASMSNVEVHSKHLETYLRNVLSVPKHQFHPFTSHISLTSSIDNISTVHIVMFVWHIYSTILTYLIFSFLLLTYCDHYDHTSIYRNNSRPHDIAIEIHQVTHVFVFQLYWTSSILFPVCLMVILHFWTHNCENAEWIERLEFHFNGI